MYEYEIRRKDNPAEYEIIFGLNREDVQERNKSFSPDEWYIARVDYID